MSDDWALAQGTVDFRDEGRHAFNVGPQERQAARRGPCVGCGYIITGGPMCGDCKEYGPPRRWRWKYDPVSEKHERVSIDERSCWHADVICGDPAYCREHGCQL